MAKTKLIKKISDLRPDTRNANKGTQRGGGLLENSLQKYGAGRSILIDKNGQIIAGNKTTEAAASIGLDEDVIVVPTDGTKLVAVQRTDIDLNSKEGRELAIADNRIGEINLDWDVEELAALADDGVELGDWWSDEELNELLNDASLPQAGDGDDSDTTPDEAQIRVQYGDLWRCGNHHVLCGDSTKTEDVARLMEGEKAQMCFTPPPYNAAGGATGGYKGSPEGRTDREMFYSDYADCMPSAEYVEFLKKCLSLCVSFSDPNAAILWNVCYNANSRYEYGEVLFSQDIAAKVRETIIWDKGVGMNIATRGILSRTAEFIFLLSAHEKYFTNQGKHETWWNIWRISNKGGDNQKFGHGASYPLELPLEGITKFSPLSGNIYDPFLGSGTTLIAAERTDRKCYGIEISPKYVNVILSRWEAETKKTAELIDRIE